ncbi:response regulator transcription factor [Paenibacillus daejeonensis]|uniref:response regulator transcription factor n=1 Tax=Paenibacillus daejeonensis TaxID=135193 RepID=UPI0003703590|nr:helix-turn-helix domain-containing protein [Paenibacillus daejeonensis]
MSGYKVLLVEDEIPARTVFRSMIEARGDLFELVGEAEDGQDGLELYKRHLPQLIVTDITMPGMNGLEMLRAIESATATMPQVIILTCHQDFQFAQQAIQLKAGAYLIKDDCLNDPELLVRTLEGMTEQVVGRDAMREKQQELEQKVRSNEIVIEQNLFLEMLRNPVAGEKWLQSLKQIGIPVHRSQVYALMLELDRSSLRFSVELPQELKLWQFAGVNVLNELLDTLGPHKVIALDKGRFVAIFSLTIESSLERLIDQVADSFSKYLKMDSLVLLRTFPSGLQDYMGELKSWVSAAYPFFYDNRPTLGGGASSAERIRYTHIPEQYVRFWGKVLKGALLESHVSSAAVEHERKSFHKQAMEHNWDPEQMKSLYLRIFLELSQFRHESDGMSDIEATFRKRLEQCQTFDAVHDSTVACFRQLKLLQGERKLDASIAKIVQRLHENLNEPFKLEELAASINYSVPYFSSMFKKTTGESFVQYLNKLRLEKAKLLLLTTDRKTFEIAEDIGFENYRSFNRLFKQAIGLTPSDFRKQGVEGHSAFSSTL